MESFPSERTHGVSVDHQFGLSPELRTEAEQLRQTLQAGPTVDVAKGILMALYGYDEQDAFAELRRVSQDHRVGMSELAVALVAQVRGPDRDRTPATPTFDGRGTPSCGQLK